MTNPRIRIQSLQQSLAPTQKRLAGYILDHPEESTLLSIHELAAKAGVSVASISRFARILGYKSLKEFKLQLGKESLPSLADIFEAITAQDTDEQIIEKVFQASMRSLAETLKILDRADLLRAAKALTKCGRVVFLGIGSSGHIAQDAALRFSQLDLRAEAYADSYQILSHALRLKKSDVALGISHSGRSTITVQALEVARQNGATTIGIANYLQSPLQRASDLFLCTSFPESRVKVAALSSRIAQMCLVDALYLLVARRKEISLETTERLNTYTEKILRLPAR